MTERNDARGRYLDLAEARFAASGFDGVSLAAVANDAGVTKQALLHFFGSKERLYAEVLSRLSKRLSSEIDATVEETPEQRLIAYFDSMIAASTRNPADARLVVRALLDSDPSSRFWPLKAYLDKLIALTLETARWRDAAPEAALAGLSHLIGAVQYVAISSAAITGMYGEKRAKAAEARFADAIRAAVREFVGAS